MILINKSLNLQFDKKMLIVNCNKALRFIFVLLFFLITNSFAFPNNYSAPLQGDTLRQPILTGPSTTPEQDSAYSRAKRLPLTSMSRFILDLQRLQSLVKYLQATDTLSYEEIARRNLTLPAEIFVPFPQDVVHSQVNILQSQYIPFVRTANPYGAKIPISAIASLLGIYEDISPIIEYLIEEQSPVKVVIYSASAIQIVTLVDAIQPAGRYKYVWDGKDERGNRQPRGDYIGEVRIGNSKYIRKRIRIE